jgi:hypothetical protein
LSLDIFLNFHSASEIYTFGQLPWNGVDDADVIRNVRKGITMRKPEACPAEVCEEFCHAIKSQC